MLLKVLIPSTVLALGIAGMAATAPPVSDADLQVAYTLCTKRYVNRDKSIPDKWQKGYENCDRIVSLYEGRQKAQNDPSTHKSTIDAIAGGVRK